MTKVTQSAQKTNSDLLMLLVSANFDKSRITIAEHELSENFLTLYLEDKEDFKSNLEDTLMYKLPVSQFSAIIKSEGLNSYEGTMYNEHSSFTYTARVEIKEPIKWYEQDATKYQQKETLDVVLQHILKSLTKNTLLVEREVAHA
jgi:hypothetical protein